MKLINGLDKRSTYKVLFDLPPKIEVEVKVLDILGELVSCKVVNNKYIKGVYYFDKASLY